MGRPKTKEEFVRNLRRTYDSFSVKDLTFDEFKNEMMELMDPVKVAAMRDKERSSRSSIIRPGRRITR